MMIKRLTLAVTLAATLAGGYGADFGAITAKGTITAQKGVASTTGTFSGDIQVNGGEIGIAADTDLIGLAANKLTILGQFLLKKDGGNGFLIDTVSANQYATLKLMDGGTQKWSLYKNNDSASDLILQPVTSNRYFRCKDASSANIFTLNTGTKLIQTAGQIHATGDLRTSADLQVQGGDIGIAADTNLLGLAADTLTVRGKVEVGTAATYLQMSASENSLLVNSMAYGSMSNSGTSYTVTMGSINTAVEIGGGFSSGQVNDVSFGSNHYLQVAEGGKYLVNWNLAVRQGIGGDLAIGGIMIDGSAQGAGRGATYIAAANAAIGLSGTAILDLAAAEQVSLFLMDGSTGSRNFVMLYGNLTIMRVGE